MSQLEMNKSENKDLLIKAIKLEKQEEYEQANEFYSLYLRNVQFRFTLWDNNKLFSTIKSDDKIVGIIEHINKGHYNFLTIDSSTVRQKSN